MSMMGNGVQDKVHVVCLEAPGGKTVTYKFM